MISTRLAPAALVVLCLALVPTVIHTYRGVTHDDGIRPKALPTVLGGLASEPTDRREHWGQRRFGTDEWVERWYGRAPRLRLTLVRTYDPKTVYHHPELAISYPEAQLGRPQLERLTDGTPVFVLRGIDDSRDLVAYALIANGQVIEDPYRAQVQVALQALVGGRRSMTLVYVQDAAPPSASLERQPAMRLLQSALEAIRTSREGASSRSDGGVSQDGSTAGGFGSSPMP